MPVKPPPEICPYCGADVPRKSLACPECGSDYETGWSEDAEAQRLDLPDDKFDYDEFVKEEFGGERQRREIRPRGISWLWWTVAVLLLLAFAWFLVGSIVEQDHATGPRPSPGAESVARTRAAELAKPLELAVLLRPRTARSGDPSVHFPAARLASSLACNAERRSGSPRRMPPGIRFRKSAGCPQGNFARVERKNAGTTVDGPALPSMNNVSRLPALTAATWRQRPGSIRAPLVL
jgi:hypothetical protein